LVRRAKKNFHAHEQKVIIYYGAAICGNFLGGGCSRTKCTGTGTPD